MRKNNVIVKESLDIKIVIDCGSEKVVIFRDHSHLCLTLKEYEAQYCNDNFEPDYIKIGRCL